jgi:hypothetical protein
VAGVNWLLAQYALGVGGILGDEMGLGKTIQTLAFIGSLKAAGQPGPHLVVVPLPVLQVRARDARACVGIGRAAPRRPAPRLNV